MHFQTPPRAQGKLVSVIHGSALDVAVDIRPDSPTVGQWTSFTLTSDGRESLYIPPGFAHGFTALSDDVVFSYTVTADYCPTAERGIRWDDPELAIDWQVMEPIVSERDASLPTLASVLHNDCGTLPNSEKEPGA